MKKPKIKLYVVVWTRISDGDIIIDYMSTETIKTWVKMGFLTKTNYAIIGGPIIKSMGNTDFDLKTLK